MVRRKFLKSTLGLLAATTLSNGVGAVRGQTSTFSGIRVLEGHKRIEKMPPIFCTAYITPNAPGQGGQEAIVARYPLTLVPQDDGLLFRRWRDRVKALNPEITMLAYQQVNAETMVPGPGHKIMRGIKDAWSRYPGGMIADARVPPLNEPRRLFDFRSGVWRSGFLNACRATLESYPYDGLFLDNCTVYPITHPFPWIKEEMRIALQTTLLELRKEFPDAIIIGNSSYSWTGLNGEMNEGRIKDVPNEFSPFQGHVLPRLELYQSTLQKEIDMSLVRNEMKIAHSYGAFYGAAVDYQHVLWFDEFDQLILDHKSKSASNLASNSLVRIGYGESF